MPLTKASWTDPDTGKVYDNLFVVVLGWGYIEDGLDGKGDAHLVVAGYASRAAYAAGKRHLFRDHVALVRNGDSATPDLSGVAAVIGAPVGGAVAMNRYQQTKRAAYTFLKDPANAGLTRFSLSDAADDGA